MKVSAVVLALGEASLFAGLAAAQTALPPPDSGATIRATAAEVLLDLVVVDKRGKPVKNLKPADVAIYEDGARQELKSFRFVGVREAQAQKPLPAQQGHPLPRSLRAVNLVCIVFHNLDPVSRKYASEAVEEFLKADLPAETYVGMFVLDDRLTAIYPFTKNRVELNVAAAHAFSLRPVDFAKASEAVLTANPNQITITTVVSGHLATTAMATTGGEVAKSVVTGADVDTGPGANALRGDQVLEQRDFSNISGMRETDKVITMINQLGVLPGRKSVLLLSNGFLTTGEPEQFQAILNKANQSGVTVYALDAAGLSKTSTAQAAGLALGQVAGVSSTQTAATRVGVGIDNTMGSTGAAKERSRQGDSLNDAVRASDTQASLRALAEGSGGFLIANTNDFRKPFQRIVDDVQAHYEASYRPTSGRYDGHLRKIEVKLARADLRVDSRTGYFAMPDFKGESELQPYETMALAALSASPLPHAFDFRASTFRFRNQGERSLGVLAFELPNASLSATSRPERKTHQLHPSLLALVKDSGGEIVDRFSLDAPFEIPDANLAAARAGAAVHTHVLSLPAGHYTVETAVLDRESGRASTAMLQFDNPAPPKGAALSSAMLIQRIEPVTGTPEPADPFLFQGKRLVPFLGASLPADAKPYLYFVVYPDRSIAEKPKLQVEFLVDGQMLAKQSADLPAPDASGAIPMLIRATAHTGNCELKITVLQGGESATQNVAYKIVAP